MKNTGRNEPCPCGSGKKYKKCCGRITESHFDYTKAIKSIDLVKRLAYLGHIGRRRKEFCYHYVAQKEIALAKMETTQIQAMYATGESISCHKGCYYCCAERVKASLQECEAIVYFLYQNESVLTSFIKAYPRWAEEAKKHVDMLEEADRLEEEAINSRLNNEAMLALARKANLYWQLQNYCPFLLDKACSIHEVRPWACATVIATTPPEWCSPSNQNKPRTLLFDLPFTDLALDAQFYVEEYEGLWRGYVPWLVFNLLTGGLRFLSNNEPRLKNLWTEFLKDPEVVAFGKQLRESR